MAVIRSVLYAFRPATPPVGFVAAFLLVLLASSSVRAEDSRIEKAREIRKEILARRPLPKRAPAPAPVVAAPREDPYEAAIAAARKRLADLEAGIENSRRRSEELAAPREKLAARQEELAAAAARVAEENRTRIEAIYRSAKLGAGAAGWHPEPAKSARLTRYLAAIATAQDQSLARLEAEHGSALAALDRARAEDAAAASEMHVLEVDRTEAVASLNRALQEAANAGRDGDAVASHMDPAADPYGTDGDPGEEGVDAEADAFEDGAGPEADAGVAARGGDEGDEGEVEAGDDSEGGGDTGDIGDIEDDAAAARAADAEREEAIRAEAEQREAEASARAVELALAKAAAKLRKDKEISDAAARAEEQAKALAASAAPSAAGQQAGTGHAGDFRWPGTAPSQPPAAGSVPVASVAPAVPASSADEEDGPPELEDGPAVLAPSSDPAAEAAQADSAKPKGFLTRLFGDDGESDKFAASRGKLAAPVAGKVVANYGQQHKSGATYRGAILRAAHAAPVRSVAAGRVSFVGPVQGLGNTVIVSHGNRYHTVYARLGSVRVTEGEKLPAGAEVGELPEDDADMHFELRDKGKAIDPMPWLKGGVPGAAR